MFSVITNIYNKKTKGPTFNGIVHSHRNTEKVFFFWQLEVFDVCTTGDTAHIGTIFKFLHVTTWFLLAQTPSFSKLFKPCTNGLVCRRLLCVLCTDCTLHSNHTLTLAIFQHTKRPLPGAAIFSLDAIASPSGRNVNCDEKQLTGENFFFWVVPSACTGFVNTCPTGFL